MLCGAVICVGERNIVGLVRTRMGRWRPMSLGARKNSLNAGANTASPAS
jgi:hypothetical protein